MKKGWLETTLGDIGNVAMCKRIFKEETTATGDIPFYKIGTFGRKADAYISSYTYNEYRAKYPFPKRGDVLISASGTIGRRVRYDGEPAYFQDSNIVWIDNDEKKVLNDYLYHFYGACEWNSTKGATISRLYNEDLRRIVIAFPESHQEQQRIVGILDDAFDGLATATANAEHNLHNASALFESHLQAVFTQRRKGWEEKSVGDLVADRLLAPPIDGNHGEIHPKKADFVSSGVPFIMASDLEDGLVNQRDCAFISRKQADSLRKGFAEDGDVLLSHKGTIGRVSILHTKHDYVMLTPQVTYYRVIAREKFLNRFLYYALQSTNFVQRMNEIAGAGSTRAYIGILKQLELPIAFPVLAEQERLANQLDALAAETQRLESIYQQKLAALGELKKSLLHQAFSGGL